MAYLRSASHLCDREGRVTETMTAGSERHSIQTFQHAAKTIHRIDPFPGHAAVSGFAAHGDLDVDPAFVAEANLVAGPKADDRRARADLVAFQHKLCGIMPAGFPFQAYRQNQRRPQRQPRARDDAGGVYHRCQRALLLARTATQGALPRDPQWLT